MASLSQYYSDYMCSNEFGGLTTPMPSSHGSSTASAMHAEATLPFGSDINTGTVSMVPFDSSDISCSSSMSSAMAALFFPAADRIGASDMSVPATLTTNYDRSSGLFAISGDEGFSAGNYCHQHDHPAYHDCGDQECSVLRPSNFWPLYPAMTCDNWEIQGGRAQRIEEPTLKIARYSAEERKERILRYLKKRRQRNFNKTIKYACRKTLADKRVRVRGRFAKNNECCEDDQTLVVKTGHNLQEAEPCYNDPEQMKPHDEEWMQEAIASLMYYRILPDNILDLPDKYLN